MPTESICNNLNLTVKTAEFHRIGKYKFVLLRLPSPNIEEHSRNSIFHRCTKHSIPQQTHGDW